MRTLSPEFISVETADVETAEKIPIRLRHSEMRRYKPSNLSIARYCSNNFSVFSVPLCVSVRAVPPPPSFSRFFPFQRPHGVEHSQYRHAYIGEYGVPEAANADHAEHHHQRFDADGEHGVLLGDP